MGVGALGDAAVGIVGKGNLYERKLVVMRCLRIFVLLFNENSDRLTALYNGCETRLEYGGDEDDVEVNAKCCGTNGVKLVKDWNDLLYWFKYCESKKCTIAIELNPVVVARDGVEYGIKVLFVGELNVAICGTCVASGGTDASMVKYPNISCCD